MGTRTGARFLPREVDRAGAQLATTQARDHGLDLDRASARIIVETLGAGAPGVLPALFRLEALWRPNDLGFFPRIDRISSDSDGLITPGVLGQNWPRLGLGAGTPLEVMR